MSSTWLPAVLLAAPLVPLTDRLTLNALLALLLELFGKAAEFCIAVGG